MRLNHSSVAYDSIQEVKSTVKAEREKIKQMLEAQKKEAFDEKQKMYLKMKMEQEMQKKRKTDMIVK